MMSLDNGSLFFFFPTIPISPQTLIYEKYIIHRILIIQNQKNKMGKLIKGIKIAAWIAEIIVASSVIVEFAEKYSGKSKNRSSASNVGPDKTTTEN